MSKKLLLVPLVLLALGGVCAAQYPAPTEGDFIIRNFRFTSGEMLPELRVHYRTIGKPTRDAQGVVRNAVLIMHGTGGNGANLLNPMFAGQLFGPGRRGSMPNATSSLCRTVSGMGSRASQATGYEVVPHYGYLDMIEANIDWTEGLRVNHARLVMGTSMGGMHTAVG